MASEAWKRTAASRWPVVLDARKLDDAHDDLLVRHAQPHVARQAGGRGKALEVLTQRFGVGHLAVAHQPSGRFWLAQRVTRPPLTCAAAR